MTTKTTFLDPEDIRRKLNELGGIKLPERATFLYGMVVVLDENGNQHLRIAMQGDVSGEQLTNCLLNMTSEAMKSFLGSCVPADAAVH